MDRSEKFYTPEEVAEYLRVTTSAIHKLLKREEITGVKVGRLWRISETALREYLHRPQNHA